MFKTMGLISVLLFTISCWVCTAEIAYISFSSNRTGNFDIYIVDTNGENLRNITDRRTEDTGPAWSPEGRFLAYASNPGGNFDIYVLDIETEKVRRLTKDPGLDADAAWSPDGRWIAFVSNRSGAYEIYKMDLRGKNLQRLTRRPGNNTSPYWSPDGQWILFRSGWRNKEGHRQAFLYVMDTDGNNPRQFVEVRGGGGAWSPDGKRILFSTTRDDADDEAAFDLFTVNPNGKERRQLTHGRKWELSGTWSPDGQWIAFEAREPHQNETSAIYVMDAAGGEVRQLTDELSMNWGAAWVPVRSAFPVEPTPLLLTTLWGKMKQISEERTIEE